MPSQDNKSPNLEEYTVLSWSGDVELKDRPNGGEPIMEAKLVRGDGVAVRLIMWVFAATFYEYFKKLWDRRNSTDRLYMHFRSLKKGSPSTFLQVVKAKPFHADQGIPYVIQNLYGTKKILPNGMPVPVDADHAARLMESTGFPHPSRWPVDLSVDDSTQDAFNVDGFLDLLEESSTSSTSSPRHKRSLFDNSDFDSPPTSLAEKAKNEFSKRTKLMAPTKLFAMAEESDNDVELEDRQVGPTMFHGDKGDDIFLAEATNSSPRSITAHRDIKKEPGTTSESDQLAAAYASPMPSILVQKKKRNAPKKFAPYESSI